MWNGFKLLGVLTTLVPAAVTDPDAAPASLESHTPQFVVTEAHAPLEVPLPTVAAAPQAKDLPAVLDAVQNAYEGTQDFTANFTQRYTYTALRKTQESSGKVAFKKPGLMRWDYGAPAKKSFVVSGGELWIHQPEDGNALVDRCFKQDGLTASVSFLWGSGNLKSEFNAEWFKGRFGAETDHHLLLTPKKPNNVFMRLILVVDPKTSRVKQSVVVDPQGNVNQFIFDDLKYNQGLKETSFKLDLPKGTHVSRIPGSCAGKKGKGASAQPR